LKSTRLVAAVAEIEALGGIARKNLNLDSDNIQVYSSVAITFLIWAALSFSAWFSFRRSRRAPGTRRAVCFVLAVVPVLLGLLCFKAQIRWSGEDDWFTVDLSWLFLIPVVLGVAALVFWFRTLHVHHAA